MKKLSGQRGFTLIETAIVLAISAIIMPALLSASGLLFRMPATEQAEITAMHDIQQLTYWITQDGNKAGDFTSGSTPDYGTFSGLELADGGTTRVSTRYFYQDHKVMREVTKNEAPWTTHRVADNIESYADISFQYTPASWVYDQFTREWSYNEAKVVATAKSTVPALDIPADPPDAEFSATIQVELRPQEQRDVAMPGNPPEAPPLPDELDFDVSGNPTILQGSYVSGSGANLSLDDELYYTTGSVKVASTYYSSWEVTSEPLPYTSITDISIAFTGQVSAPDVTVGIYVYNPDDPAHVSAGYATSPDQESYYSVKNVDYSALFPLAAEDVTYVNSLPAKVVKVKIKASRSNAFNLRADMLLFRVAGTLEPGYAIDYDVDAAEGPVVITGTYGTGSGTDLTTDDTLYFMVNSTNVSTVPTVTWDAVSEVITTSISSIEVRWIGRVERQPTTQQFYIYNLADHGGNGYASTPDFQATYTQINTDTPLTFSLSASDLAYINTQVPKVVMIRVKTVRAAGDLAFTLSADQLLFRVQP